MISKGRPHITLTLSEDSYSQPTVYNGNNTGRKISYTYMKSVLNLLVNNTSTRYEVGGVSEYDTVFAGVDDTGKKKWRRVACDFDTSKLFLDPEILQDMADNLYDFNEVSSVIEIRDKAGKPIGKRLTERERELVKMLETFNLQLDNNSVSVEDEVFYFSVKKIYNNSSTKEGGRIYMLGDKVGQLISKDVRRKIVINGIPTVELDYAQLWPRIAADMVGQDLADDFDVYGVVMEGYCPETLRDVCKIGMMCLLNAGSFENALYSMTSETKKGKLAKKISVAKQNGMWDDFPIYRKLLSELMERNAYLMDFFFQNKATTLMNIESCLMDYLIERSLEDDRILVPIYDSVVVQQDYADKAKLHMEKAYEVVIGGNNCVVRVK
jgi:hypothetical protein